jgi:hypothetical protein
MLLIQAEKEITMKVICYKIQSGWINAPQWYCRVEFDKAIQIVAHIHTTKDLGAAPSVFKGNVSGLFFHANGVFPIESRKGDLLIAESEKTLDQMTTEEKAVLNWEQISVEDAIAFLNQ